jgi:hypothetical protein
VLVEINTLKILFSGSTNEEVFSEIIKQLGTPTTEDLSAMEVQLSELKLPSIHPVPWENTLNLEG